MSFACPAIIAWVRCASTVAACTRAGVDTSRRCWTASTRRGVPTHDCGAQPELGPDGGPVATLAITVDDVVVKEREVVDELDRNRPRECRLSLAPTRLRRQQHECRPQVLPPHLRGGVRRGLEASSEPGHDLGEGRRYELGGTGKATRDCGPVGSSSCALGIGVVQVSGLCRFTGLCGTGGSCTVAEARKVHVIASSGNCVKGCVRSWRGRVPGVAEGRLPYDRHLGLPRPPLALGECERLFGCSDAALHRTFHGRWPSRVAPRPETNRPSIEVLMEGRSVMVPGPARKVAAGSRVTKPRPLTSADRGHGQEISEGVAEQGHERIGGDANMASAAESEWRGTALPRPVDFAQSRRLGPVEKELDG